jgi:hypothetical protein
VNEWIGLATQKVERKTHLRIIRVISYMCTATDTELSTRLESLGFSAVDEFQWWQLLERD